jgi:uncharacterized OB-fold protein
MKRSGLYKRREILKKRKIDISFTLTQQPNSEQQQQQPKHAAAIAIKPPPIIMYQVRDYDIVCNI